VTAGPALEPVLAPALESEPGGAGSPVERAIAPDLVARPRRRGLIGPFGGRQIAAGLLIVAVVVVVIVGASAPLGSVGSVGPIDPRPTPFMVGPPVEGLHAGDLAPELAAPRSDGSTFQLTDLAGRPVRLADLVGRAVWINFWASWCPPCQAETPILREMDRAYRDRGLTIVGISVQETNAADVGAYVSRYSLGYTIAADLDGDIFRRYKVYGLPTQFFIAPDGRIAAVLPRPLDDAGARAQIEAILPR
jgi:thiol-disulfide isomerase/thioredoxin